jgi:hypothetical protein
MIEKYCAFVLILLLPLCAYAQGKRNEVGKAIQESVPEGGFFQYAPPQVKKPLQFLVVIHGMVPADRKARDVAKSYLETFKKYSEKTGSVLIVPIFTKDEYGGDNGPIGGYRGLVGRNHNADAFLNSIISSYQELFSGYDGRFYLLGHSAGAQFVSRYIACHPDRIIAASIVSAGSYMFIDNTVKFPYGIKRLRGNLVWKDNHKRSIDISIEDDKLKEMVSLDVSVIVGEEDRSLLRDLKGQRGHNRYGRGKAWVKNVKDFAVSRDLSTKFEFIGVKGAGHNSELLFRIAIKELFKR